MFNYLFPIFCFGLVITGIVFLGLREAADLAKQMAERSKAMSPPSDQPEKHPRSRQTDRP